ncbi:MAG: hypothetical protein Q8Q25_01375 [bacterium]|nr:hypothetical protein [bacterium]
MILKITGINKIASTAASTLFFYMLVTIFHFFKVSFIIGSWAAFFSGTSMLTPLVGAWAGCAGSCGMLGLVLLKHLFLGGIVSAKWLACCVPGFAASLYWGNKSALVRVGIPMVCMVLFAVHPVGFQALPYALYWLIPFGLFFVRRKTIFLESLGSTFIAHAVGSVIWLYTVPMHSSVWLSLIPLVLVERLLFALGMTGLYYVLSWLYKKINSAVRLPILSART